MTIDNDDNNDNNNNNNNVTLRLFTENRPDIMLDYGKKTENLPTDRCCNTSGQKCHSNGSRKKLKSKDFCVEVQRMCNVKGAIVPVMIGAKRMIQESLKKNLEALSGEHSVDSLHKTAVLGTSHMVREVVRPET